MTFYDISLSWHWSPFSLLALLLLCLIYSLALWGIHRANPQKRPLKKRQLAWFSGALLLIAGCFLTPLDLLARSQLFLAHMFQVVLLATFAAPCLLLACPDWLFAPLFTRSIPRALLKLLTRPVIASAIFNLTFLIWHIPFLFTRTMSSSTLYHSMLWSIFLTSLLSWWPLIGGDRQLHSLSYPAKMFYTFLDAQPVALYALLLVFGGVVLYPYAIPPGFPLDAYADQASAGALLLIPGFVDLIVMSPFFFRWLAQIEERARRTDERRQALLEAQLHAEQENANHDIYESSPGLVD